MAISITLPEKYNLTGNPIKVKVVTTTTSVDYHYICLKIYFGNYSIPLAIDKLQVIDNEAHFDIAEYLKIDKIQGFSYHNSEILNCTYLLKDWKVKAYELYDNDGVEHNETQLTELRYAIQGGLSSKLLAQLNYLGTNFSEKFIDAGKYLTWQQNDYKITGRDDEERLFFLHKDGNTIKVNVLLSYTNGSSSSEIVYTKEIVPLFHIFEINTSFEKLGLSSYETETKKIIDYRIRILDEHDNVITEEFKYKLDENFYNEKKQLFFKNSFGCYDTIAFRGLSEQNNEFISEIIISESEQKINSKLTETFKLNSGFLSNLFQDAKKAASYFSELYLSTEVYFLNEGSLLDKIIIISKKQSIYRDKIYLYSIEIEYKLDEDANYSELENYELPDVFMVVDELGNPTPFKIDPLFFHITN